VRLILIDNASGYIWGDSADFAASRSMESATDAARQLDESLGEHGRTYEEHGPRYRPASNESAYHVYRADIDGSEAVAVAVGHDGQDADTIEAVERDCEKLAVVVVTASDSDD
jgi:hypothetical protein